MKISIHDHTTIADVQQQFSERFPYLKLEFFSKRHRPGNGTHLKFLLPHDQRLGDIRKTHNEGEIDIYPDMRVSELEQLFELRNAHIRININFTFVVCLTNITQSLIVWQEKL